MHPKNLSTPNLDKTFYSKSNTIPSRNLRSNSQVLTYLTFRGQKEAVTVTLVAKTSQLIRLTNELTSSQTLDRSHQLNQICIKLSARIRRSSSGGVLYRWQGTYIGPTAHDATGTHRVCADGNMHKLYT